MKYLKGFLIVTTVVLAANLASAQLDPIPKESGLSGYIGPAAGAVRYKGNMIAGLSKINIDFGEETTKSLTEEAESRTQGIGLLNFELGYNFASTRTRLFVGSTLQDFIRFDLAQQIGVRQEIGNMGTLQAGVLLSGMPVTVWKDPYVANTPRQDTDRESTGGRLVWGKILNTNFLAQLEFRKIDIDEEQSGIGLGLTPAQRQLLDRNGDLVRGELQYRFRFGSKHGLAPAFRYAKEDLDGDAMSNDAYTFQLTYLYFGDTVNFAANALFGRADYDAINPIYNQTREDDHYGGTATLFYKNPFGWEWFGSDKISFYGTLAYFVSDSNINFYTTELTMGVLGIMYRF
jgi:hypothetical protein